MEEKNQPNPSFLPLTIFVAALLISGSILYSKFGDGNSRALSANQPSRSATQANLLASQTNLTDDDVVLGDPKAPVTMVIFGDYQCPFCGRMFQEVEGRLKEIYVKTGKLKMVYRDFPLDQLHPYARTAAEMAECARDQGKYWAYHDALFNLQDQIPTLDFVTLAGQLGLDKNKFSACSQSGKYKAEVEKDYEDGLILGINGTPTSFVNGERLVGAQPYSAYQAAIEAALAK